VQDEQCKILEGTTVCYSCTLPGCCSTGIEQEEWERIESAKF